MEVIQALICIWEMGMLFYAAFQLLPQRRMHVITKIIWWMCVALDILAMIYQRHFLMYSRYYLLVVTVITFVLTIWKFDVAKIDGLWGVATYFETIYFLDVFITIVFSTLAGTDEKFFQYIFYNITDERILIYFIGRIVVLALIIMGSRRAFFFRSVYRESRNLLLIFPVLEYLALMQCDVVFIKEKQKIGSRNGLLFFAVYLFLFVLFVVYYGYKQEKNQIALLSEKNKVMEQEYRNIVSWSKKRSSLIHDAKNHLIALEGILSNGETDRAL